MSRIRKTAALVSATALLGGSAVGIAQAASSSSTGSDGPPAGHRQGGPVPTAQLDAIAKQLGVTTTQLKAALDASRPAKPADGKPGDGKRGDGMATELAKALGVDVSKVTAILDANRPARPANGARPSGPPPAAPSGTTGGRPPRHDDTKLVAALASGLDIDTAKVKAAFATIEAAHKADHGDHDGDMFAAVAKQLGLSTATVKAAFEANRPAMPARP
jgi:hypothetical protein